MATYLFEKVDENICLYRGFKFDDTRFDEQSMTLIDLDIFCDELTDSEICYNFLRFTDQENPQRLKIMGNDSIPTFYNQIDCE